MHSLHTIHGATRCTCGLLALIGAAIVPAAYAVDDLSLQNTTVGSGQTSNQQANVTITASNNYTVSSGGQANLTAGIRILLQPAVTVASGGGFHAKIDFNGNGVSDLTEELTAVAPTYFTSFEDFSLGNINGNVNWYSGAGTVTVVGGSAADGTRFVSLPAATPTNSLIKHFLAIPGQAIEYVDFYLKPVFTGSLNMSTYLDLGVAQIGFLQDSGNGGRLQVLSTTTQGAAQWMTVGPAVALDSSQRAANWLRVTFRVNATTRLWDLFLDGQLVASSLPLNSAGSFAPYFTLYGSTSATTALDDLYLGSSNPLPADTLAPTTPTNLVSINAGSTSANLYWTASTGTIGVAGYNIYRNGVLIGTTSGQRTYFTDQNLTVSTGYSYTVRAFNSGGVTSAISTSLSVTTAASSTPNLEVFSPLK